MWDETGRIQCLEDAEGVDQLPRIQEHDEDDDGLGDRCPAISDDYTVWAGFGRAISSSLAASTEVKASELSTELLCSAFRALMPT